jgi:hypothetical protein
MLAQTIAEVMRCRHFFAQGQIVFFGQSPNDQIAAYAWEVLSKRQAKARQAYLASISKRYKQANRTGKADTYAEGWAAGVYIACEHLPRFAPHNAVDKHIIEKYKVRKVETRKASYNGNANKDLYAGYEAGCKERIQPGVAHNPAPKPKKVGDRQLKLF